MTLDVLLPLKFDHPFTYNVPKDISVKVGDFVLVPFQNKDFGWTTNFNISFSKNKLLSFPDLATSTYRNQFVIGEALNIQKVYRYTGLDPQTGVFTFEDMNGDGVLSGLDRQVVKDFNPSFFGGLSNQFTYGRWALDVMFQFVKQDFDFLDL